MNTLLIITSWLKYTDVPDLYVYLTCLTWLLLENITENCQTKKLRMIDSFVFIMYGKILALTVGLIQRWFRWLYICSCVVLSLNICSPLWKIWLTDWLTDKQTRSMRSSLLWRVFLHSITAHLNLFLYPLSVAVIVSGKQKHLQLLKIRQADTRRLPAGKYRRRPPPLKRYAGDVLAPVISIQFHTHRNVFNLWRY